VASYEDDKQAQDLISKLSVQPSVVPHFSLVNGVILFNNRIWLSKTSSLQPKLMAAFHNSAVGCHSGIPATYHKMKQYFYWPGMKAAIQSFVKQCPVCHQAKPDRARYPGLLQPLPVLDTAWEVVSMDFVEGLPRSGHYNCILVVVDKLTKFAHFIPLCHPFTALTVAKEFLDNVYKLHGMPLSIISDRDRVFTSTLWKELFGLAEVKLQMSSAYHPQTDDQTERVNLCMETYLRCFVHTCPNQWSSWLSLAEFWYNTSLHSTLGRSPFEVLYGHQPCHFGLQAADACSHQDLSSWLRDRAVMQSVAKQHLLHAQDRMKRQADKHRSERQFQVGDFVYLKLQPYI
jgi:hypothetical protein